MIAPVSPIMGYVVTRGNANLTPIVQLLNPAGSGVQLVCFELYASIYETTGAANAKQLRQRRTRSPLTPAGTLASSVPRRMKQEDLTPIHGILRGGQDTVGHIALTDAQCQVSWLAVDEPLRLEQPFIRRPGSFPLTILPGSAWEAQAPIGTLTTDLLRLVAVWDELAYP